MSILRDSKTCSYFSHVSLQANMTFNDYEGGKCVEIVIDLSIMLLN